ncbi:MAG TPA: hypothetical protein DCO77_00805 [Nitrospiraceae bacterium]|nr:hypothetical protein [Nitrospiraceae bacterium]
MQKIIEDLVGSVNGAQAAIFLDDDGESIAQFGDSGMDMRLLGAWKEIHLDHIKDIADRVGLGTVNAVLFTQEEGNALIVPVSGEYALLLFLSAYADIQSAMNKIKESIVLLQKDIE